MYYLKLELKTLKIIKENEGCDIKSLKDKIPNSFFLYKMINQLNKENHIVRKCNLYSITETGNDRISLLEKDLKSINNLLKE